VDDALTPVCHPTQAEQLCTALALPQASKVASLALRSNYLGVNGAAALACCLPHTSLTSLDVSDNVLLGRYLSDKEHAYAAAVADSTAPDCSGLTRLLLAGAQLRHLCLSFNHLGDEGAAALGEVFAQSHDVYGAMHLEVGFNHFQHPRSVSLLCGSLRRPLGSGLALHSLCLRNNTLRAEGAAAVGASLGLTGGMALAVAELCVMNNHLGPEGAAAMAAARNNPWLVKLDLTGNLLGAAGVSAFLDAFYPEGAAEAHAAAEAHPRLEELLLHRNNAGDAGARAASRVLMSLASCNLKRLVLSNCHIHSPGAAALATALAANTSLEHLNLQRNHLYAEDEQMLKAAASTIPRRELLLGHGPI
jgi:Ran GTPase-activating protein (RanGAP) involved in mRNA processing and transport